MGEFFFLFWARQALLVGVFRRYRVRSRETVSSNCCNNIMPTNWLVQMKKGTFFVPVESRSPGDRSLIPAPSFSAHHLADVAQTVHEVPPCVFRRDPEGSGAQVLSEHSDPGSFPRQLTLEPYSTHLANPSDFSTSTGDFLRQARAL